MPKLIGGRAGVLGLAAGLAWITGQSSACRREAERPSALAAESPVVPPAPAVSVAREDVASTVRTVEETGQHPWLTWGDLRDVASALRAVYASEPDALFWFEGDRPHSALAGAVATLGRAHELGLSPADYDAERLAAEWDEVRAGRPVAGPDRALFDLAVSVSVLRELAAVRHGRVDPRSIAFGYDIQPKKFDGAAALRQARDGEGVAALLASLEPTLPHYVRGKAALLKYRRLAAAGEPEAVPGLPKGQRKVEPGRPWSGVAALEARLRVFGDLEGGAPSAPVAPDGSLLYDGALVPAVKRFQGRHVLEADGVIGAATIEALNVPLARRVRQLELALERKRWLPEMGSGPTVFVNVPLFRLWASDPVSGGEPLRMNVVVGKSVNHRTPIFVDRMEYVVFRPYWTPPYGIAVKEIVPRARRDPGYFARENLEIVARGDANAASLPPTPDNLAQVVAGRLFVRQRPGPHNSLGLAKFIFPNSESIYMHGTPATQLFSRVRRDFSHGCIRVEDPAGLAEWLLGDQPEWTRARIDAAMQAERETRVNLKQPVPVVLFYDTVHVNSENVEHFVADIYGHDRRLDEALREGYPYREVDAGGER